MFGLALHTSTPELGLAISDFDTNQRHQTWELGRDLSSRLHSLLQGFLAHQSWQDLGFVVVCIGPGGFTGTRIGVTTARTLSQQLEIPLFGISSLAAIAHNKITASDSESSKSRQPIDISVTMPAKRGAVYGAVYHWDGEILLPKLDNTVLPADSWKVKQAQWSQPLLSMTVESGVGLANTTLSLLQLGYEQFQSGNQVDWREVVPFYGQHPVTV
ncbi:MAG: tRNA (adenosine(37)-N6)-threonylcarbamoyltransferase complex dimerization subunit type 1 TsaB [Leptolyngbya sp. SIO3F4]|nr:tRNA (adenosine(37)-N6)-threonylcarbamoyltransferase complex dimerization subunit type 1 TsaB [Leptolyngbya sp. SIO3F4]